MLGIDLTLTNITKILRGAGGGAALNVADVFGVTLGTGNGATQQYITGKDYVANKGLVWGKNRDGTYSNTLVDTERGAGAFVSSNKTNAENNYIEVLKSFNSDGFTVGIANETNRNGSIYVFWEYIAAPKFFDIIKYTGDGVAGREIPHSLGVQAGQVEVKRLDTGGDPWGVQHRSLGGTQYLLLNTTAAAATGDFAWDDTPMTDSVVTLGAANFVNGDGFEYIMYVYAHDPSPEGIIQCGSYVGTGAAGNKIVLGWEPQYLEIKNATLATDWMIMDTTRGMSAGADALLYPNLSVAEQSLDYIDTEVDGFTVQGTANVINGSGHTYIYKAIRAPSA